LENEIINEIGLKPGVISEEITTQTELKPITVAL